MADKEISLININLNALSKPACKLIDAVQSGIGAIYEPTRIRRKAKAEADALLILAHARAQEKEIAFRAEERLAHLELRRQKNIDTIVKGAIEALPESADEKPVDEDWMVQFFNSCQDIGDKEMQSLWSKLLAGEVTRPGSYSLRTLHLVKTLRKEDAQLFSRYCRYVWAWDMEGTIFYGVARTKLLVEFLMKVGLRPTVRNHLQALGLISFSSDLGIPLNKDNPVTASYFGQRFIFKSTSDTPMGFPVENLTDIGTELFPISGAERDEEYPGYVVESLLKERQIEVQPIEA